MIRIFALLFGGALTHDQRTYLRVGRLRCHGAQLLDGRGLGGHTAAAELRHELLGRLGADERRNTGRPERELDG
jgi:hypothetical protein